MSQERKFELGGQFWLQNSQFYVRGWGVCVIKVVLILKLCKSSLISTQITGHELVKNCIVVLHSHSWLFQTCCCSGKSELLQPCPGRPQLFSGKKETTFNFPWQQLRSLHSPLQRSLLRQTVSCLCYFFVWTIPALGLCYYMNCMSLCAHAILTLICVAMTLRLSIEDLTSSCRINVTV